MPALLQIGTHNLTAEQVLPLLAKHRLVPQLAKGLLIEDAIQEYSIDEAEHLAGCQRFYQQQQITSEQDLEQWLQQQRLERSDLTDLINRELQLQKFKTAKWETQIESHFYQRKSQIDQVVFSMIRVQDLDIAEEIYFRLATGEATFVELAPQYSVGIQSKTKGISGPVELGNLDPLMANALATLQSNEVLSPLQIGGWWVVMQLEATISAQLDEAMRQRLSEELFNQWVYDEVQKLLAAPNLQN
jgi:parvulin-like peptidyl-prolyl isomerase